jgi:TRAP-type C4-dicarboxylate transport system substrate-binding protein
MPSRTSIFFLALVSLLLNAFSSDARVLKIATLAPDGSVWMQQLRKGASEIAQKTDGRIELKFYPGGIMGNDKTVMRKIRVGQLHGGAFASGSLTGVYRDAAIYGLPFLFRSYAEADYVRGHMDRLLREGLESGGMVALGISEGGFAYFVSDQPLRSVDDLKGKKVWAPEGDLISRIVLEAAGISPVPLPIADIYTSLQTGLVDTVASSPTGTIALQWHTKVKYLTDVPLFYLVGMFAIDKKAFDQLDPQDQRVTQVVLGRILEELGARNREDNKNAKRALRNQGIEFVTPSAAELERWRAIANASLAKMKAAGAYSDAMLKILQRHLEDFRRGSRAADGG